MAYNITRRKALTAGAALTGIAISAGCARNETSVKKNEASAKKRASLFPKSGLWPWSPPEHVERDLTPGSTPIRLAAFNGKYMINYPENESITEVIKRVRESGYTSTNSSGPKHQRNPWLDATEAEIDELKDTLKKYDVTYCDVHAYMNNIHPDMSIRQKNWKHVAQQCEVAERVGCPLVTTHTGSCSPVSAVTIHRDNWSEKTWKISVRAIQQILKDTTGMKVSLAVEALNLANVNNPVAHKRLRDDIGDPRVKVCLDPTNMINLAVYNRTTELINECFDILGEYILVAHAKDSLVTPNKMSAYLTQVLPGTGVIDYEQYLVRLSRLKYPRTLIIEHLKTEDYPKAKKFIEDTAKKVGVTIYS